MRWVHAVPPPCFKWWLKSRINIMPLTQLLQRRISGQACMQTWGDFFLTKACCCFFYLTFNDWCFKIIIIYYHHHWASQWDSEPCTYNTRNLNLTRLNGFQPSFVLLFQLQLCFSYMSECLEQGLLCIKSISLYLFFRKYILYGDMKSFPAKMKKLIKSIVIKHKLFVKRRCN